MHAYSQWKSKLKQNISSYVHSVDVYIYIYDVCMYVYRYVNMYIYDVYIYDVYVCMQI